ncbi:malate synthase G [Candidatus Spongiihabitans sp.]|uniref:malate synthase G n=1 Tax=Candidatus Spongiihabitans sp. TaxID=3101308 RepID=UPI003C6FB9C0
MTNRININDLSVDQSLYELIKTEILPGSGVSVDRFWSGFENIVKQLGGRNKTLLEKRDELQQKLDEWHKSNQQPVDAAVDVQAYKTFLKNIGYLLPEEGAFEITTENVDEEISTVAAPQLVVPVDNARYALNAANARWNSLYDALYGTDIILEVEGCKKTAKYNPVRGAHVIRYVREFLDQAVPLAIGSHAYAVKYTVKSGNLAVVMGDGSEAGLGWRECFAGYRGDPESPSNILLKHNNLHIDICIGEGLFIGRGDLANIYDVKIESALTTIMDCEDSVAAVDAEDKVRVYRNWAGLMRGDLKTTIRKSGKTLHRELEPDREYLAPDGKPFRLHGRSMMFVRHVGTHMYSDAVTCNGEQIPETFLDAMVTVAAAMLDLRGQGRYRNSRVGSVYVVKPKMHGPDEIAAAVELFALVEDALGLGSNTIKIGIMDEERRTTVNLKECIRAASARVVFINTGFLDRTGDEIHSCMEAGPVIPKNDMKLSPWLLAYEDRNVDLGLEAGMLGHGQIGKGMWAAPDNMMAMMEQKIAHPRAGANTAWVPSPTAATLHAIHYHQVNVATRQRELKTCMRASIDDILTIPVFGPDDIGCLRHGQLVKELENNAQGILGYVVKWIDQGIGCSKVADINGVALMEDRATLRISSQHIANWLHHGLTTEKQVKKVFEKMAGIVDRQNSSDPMYQAMADDFDASIAFQAALELVFKGREMANGYTEQVLHARRKQAKALRQQ